ncbi:MAG: hypothetical protein NZ930_02975 [Candidatus Bipolaricaulota bacterium]|nr:hypothetical protein [Candidatus Bipolaricaulota bacterium]MDW8030750.1 hypothetical protein [Candidatus Bipolaricaulota bacterium]
MLSYQTQMKVGLIVLILAIPWLGLNIIDAIRQDIWGRAWLQIVNLGLLSLAALIVIAAIWAQYVKQQPVGPMPFIILALIPVMVLGIAWKYLAQAVRS